MKYPASSVSDPKREIDELRQEIAKLDAQVLAALERRAKAARTIGELRAAAGEPPQLPNERSALHALVARASAMPPENVRTIFREVFAACLALEMPAKVAYVGPEGSASHVAARAKFGAAAQLVPRDGVAAALDEVVRGRAEFAIVPLETRALGTLADTIQALRATELRINATLESTSTLHLMNRTGNVADIEKIYATAADHGRAAGFLAQHPTRVSVLDVRSSLFACQIALEDHGAAALACEEVGGPLGLQLARRNVADAQNEERARYAIVGARPSGRTGEDVTAIVFEVKDAPGALLDVLRQFAERGINLVRMQSHPQPGDAGATGWSYLFFVEVVGHATDRPLVGAFEEVRRLSHFFKVLGSYAAAS